ncbi:hypothetical protein BH11MYX3_BH11MYX3_37220 [soil metagenome]
MGIQNQNGRGVQGSDEHRPSWRPQDQQSSRDSGDEYGQGQSGYGAGRHADDRSMQFRNRNQATRPGQWEDQDRGFGVDDRFSGGRGGEEYWMDRGDRGGSRDDRSERDRGGHQGGFSSQGSMGTQGYGGSREMGMRDDTHRGSQGRGMGGQQYGGGQYGGNQMSGGGRYDPGQQYGGRENEGPYGGGQRGSQPFGGRQMDQQRGMHRGKGPQGYQRSDERIREQVCEALTDHEHLDASNIEVTVKSGEVTLSGTVDERQAKRMAEDIAENLPGVKDVVNQIKIGSDMQSRTQTSMGSSSGKSDPNKARA